jgi:hypothetical protein
MNKKKQQEERWGSSALGIPTQRPAHKNSPPEMPCYVCGHDLRQMDSLKFVEHMRDHYQGTKPQPQH